jgi:hypothetical protein
MTGKLDEVVCKTCFWAFPEDYEHIAMQQIRRSDVIWQNGDVPVHDRLKAEAKRRHTTVAEILRTLARQRDKDS